LKIVENLEA